MSTDGDRRIPVRELVNDVRAKVAVMARRYEVTSISDLGRAVIEATACPECQAELGLPCVDQPGQPIEVVHDARIDIYDDGLLTALEQMAAVATRAVDERDRLIIQAVDAGLSSRQVGAAAGLTHTAVQYIVRRQTS